MLELAGIALAATSAPLNIATWTEDAMPADYSNALTAEFVRSILDYDPDTGVFTWKRRHDVGPRWNGKHPGKVAGTLVKPGRSVTAYVSIRINGVAYRAHRLAWLITHGRWPIGDIDHDNGDGTDNRIKNLREATRTQNNANSRRQKNNTTGIKGVSPTSDGRYMASICRDGKQRNLGRFDTPEDAHEAYKTEAIRLFGEFARVE